MPRFLCFSILTALIALLGACGPVQAVEETALPAGDQQLALETLLEFLTDLHDGRYTEAVELYAGPYETMIYQNPSVAPQDLAHLMQHACTINGAECLAVRTAGLDRQTTSTEFLFKVEFQTGDGMLFVLGPCCGASETEQPSTSAFQLRVVKDAGGRFHVMDMPPYAP